jgi:Polysaccharide deacetylase
MKPQYLYHLVATKGVFHGLQRLGQIATRFSRGEKRFGEMISFLATNRDCKDIRITFCVTASLLQHHLSLVRQLQDLGHDIASHGYFHTDMKRKSKQEQSNIVQKTYQTFTDANLPVLGFRCPYLSYNNDTMQVLEASPYTWTSQDLIFWESVHHPAYDKNGVSRLLALYHVLSATQSLSLPRLSRGLVNIPITAPDDEMVIERYKIRDSKKITEIWLEILEKTHQRGELFHLMFHPERFDRVGRSLVDVLRRARQLEPTVWITSLSAVSKWWEERSKAQWTLEQPRFGHSIAWIRAPKGATVVVKSRVAPGRDAALYGNYYRVEPVGERDGMVAYTAGHSRRRWTIGVSQGCSRKLIEFLTDEGFCVEQAAESAVHSFYFDGSETFTDEDKLSLLYKLDRSPEPLLRLWRWPDEARSALVISSDVDSITVADFLRRGLHF